MLGGGIFPIFLIDFWMQSVSMLVADSFMALSACFLPWLQKAWKIIVCLGFWSGSSSKSIYRITFSKIRVWHGNGCIESAQSLHFTNLCSYFISFIGPFKSNIYIYLLLACNSTYKTAYIHYCSGKEQIIAIKHSIGIMSKSHSSLEGTKII